MREDDLHLKEIDRDAGLSGVFAGAAGAYRTT
jgi:hypothetical protein